MAQELTRIVNTQPRLLQIPGAKADQEVAEACGDPVGTVYPRRNLVPGGNNVPLGHMLSLSKLERHRGVGKVWRQWQAMGWVKPGPDTDIGKPEGPGSLSSLDAYSDKGALAMIMAEDSPMALRRLYGADRRPDVRAAIVNRLGQLGVTVDGEDGTPAAPAIVPEAETSDGESA